MTSDMFNSSYHWVLILDPKELLNNSIYEPLHNGNVLLVSPYNERKEMVIILHNFFSVRKTLQI